MSNSKIHIEKNTVQETLIIPLYGRKMCTEQFPNLFQDPKAVELIDSLDYDFTAMEKKSKSIAYRFGALEVAMRETDLGLEIKDYLKVHPNAAVVNLGCGLDQTAENQDNGTCKIYNIDMPDIIAAREQVIEVQDDGVGFETETNKAMKTDNKTDIEQDKERRSHIGLVNLKERLEYMCNGTLSIQSQQGNGTLVKVIIPKKSGGAG